MMKRAICLIIPILLLECSTNRVDNTFYREGEEIVRIISELHRQGKYILDEKD